MGKTHKQYDKEPLRVIKRYTLLTIRKQLAESLILSKLDYCNESLFDIPKYMKQQLQKVENLAAGFVVNKYANINGVINIKCLPIEEWIEDCLAILGSASLLKVTLLHGCFSRF